MLTAEILSQVMGASLPLARYRELLIPMNNAMMAAQCTTPRRAAAWYSQLGHESGGLVHMAEIKKSDPKWSADRTRYRGRGPIQLTWEGNYRKFGVWCKATGLVTDSEVFVRQPELVEEPKWGFLAASWYWLYGGPKPGQINGFADAGDIFSVSRCVNGWSKLENGEPRIPNGMEDRQRRWDKCISMGDSIVPSGTPPTEVTPVATWTGDPVWIEDVLRPALGSRLKTLPGWQNSGHGDFADIRGVMVHHTGNSKEAAQSIRDGRPDLEGPLANLHIAPNGDVTIVAVGVCWHAGQGSYPWLPTNNANQHMIGIECAWPTVTNGKYNSAERWPDAQIISMRDTCAALALKLDLPATRIIGHKEWAGVAQGKWDPGNLDMMWFRGEVAKDMRGEFDPKKPTDPAPEQPGPILPPDYAKEIWDQLRLEWPQLGGQTLANALGEVRDKVLGVDDHAKWKAGLK